MTDDVIVTRKKKSRVVEAPPAPDFGISFTTLCRPPFGNRRQRWQACMNAAMAARNLSELCSSRRYDSPEEPGEESVLAKRSASHRRGPVHSAIRRSDGI